MTIRIRAIARGPLLVEREGDEPLILIGSDGAEIDVAHLKKLRLCRCGASAHAPICDGAHHRVDFERPCALADDEGAAAASTDAR